MKRLVSLLPIMFFGVSVCFAHLSFKPVENDKLINRIEGIVWSPTRQPVPDVYVELQNENYSTLSRTRTSSSGRFSFTVSRPGTYNVRVLTTGTNYLEATESVEIIQVGRVSSDSPPLDIYLKIDKRKINSGVAGVTEAVFVQEVPDAARKLYKNGVKDINVKNDKGFDEIEEALKIFPEYFDALNTLGREYTQRKEYQKSLLYLIKAIDINRRSFSSFYALGYSCYKLNHIPEAIEAGGAAVILQPNSINAQLLYGTVLSINGSYEKSEKALLEAKKLSKNAPMPEVHWQLALLYNKLKRNKEEADELEEYLKIQPNTKDKKEIQDLIATLREKAN